MRQRPKVGEILLRAGAIDEMQLRAALGDQATWGNRLGATLVKMGLVEEENLVRALAQQLQLPVVRLEGKCVQQEVLDLLPVELAEKHMCVPLFVKEEAGTSTLFVGMDDPTDLAALDELMFRTGMPVKPVLVSPSELCEALDRFYHRGDRALPMEGEGAAAGGDAESSPSAAPSAAGSLVRESLFRATSDTELEAIGDTGTSADAGGADAGGRANGQETNQVILRALCQLLIEKGLIGRDELQARIREAQAHEDADAEAAP
jgi:hypothetical protein